MARINNLTNFLTDVSSAIKEKIGDDALIPASQFDTKIIEIETGGNYQTKSITLRANGSNSIIPDTGYDAISELDVIVQVPDIPTQVKSTSISSNGNISILPDTGYDAMTRVDLEVNVPSIEINNQDKTITENGTYIADTGYTGLGEVTVNVGEGTPIPITIPSTMNYDAFSDTTPCIDIPFSKELGFTLNNIIISFYGKGEYDVNWGYNGGISGGIEFIEGEQANAFRISIYDFTQDLGKICVRLSAEGYADLYQEINIIKVQHDYCEVLLHPVNSEVGGTVLIDINKIVAINSNTGESVEIINRSYLPNQDVYKYKLQFNIPDTTNIIIKYIDNNIEMGQMWIDIRNNQRYNYDLYIDGRYIVYINCGITTPSGAGMYAVAKVEFFDENNTILKTLQLGLVGSITVNEIIICDHCTITCSSAITEDTWSHTFSKNYYNETITLNWPNVSSLSIDDFILDNKSAGVSVLYGLLQEGKAQLIQYKTQGSHTSEDIDYIIDITQPYFQYIASLNVIRMQVKSGTSIGCKILGDETYEVAENFIDIGTQDLTGFTPAAETKRPMRTITLTLHDHYNNTILYTDTTDLCNNYSITEGPNGEAQIVIQTKYPTQYETMSFSLFPMGYDYNVWIDINPDGDTNYTVTLPVRPDYTLAAGSIVTNIGSHPLPAMNTTIRNTTTGDTYEASTYDDGVFTAFVPNDGSYATDPMSMAYNGIDYYIPSESFATPSVNVYNGVWLGLKALIYNTAEMWEFYVKDNSVSQTVMYNTQYKLDILINDTVYESINPLGGSFQPTCSLSVGDKLQMFIYKNNGTEEEPIWDSKVYTFVDYTITENDINKSYWIPPTATSEPNIFIDVLTEYWSNNS